MKMISSTITLIMILCAMALPAYAQQYPSKPITIIAPFPPGGVTDVYSRWAGNGLQQRWGQPVIIDDRPGAGGWIGVQALGNAAPDGHTLMSAVQVFASPGTPKPIADRLQKEIVDIVLRTEANGLIKSQG